MEEAARRAAGGEIKLGLNYGSKKEKGYAHRKSRTGKNSQGIEFRRRGLLQK